MEVKGFLVILFIIIIIAGYFIFIKGNNNSVYYPTPEESNNLTLYLNQLGVTLYYSPTCPHCIEQKKFINFTMLNNKIDISNQTTDIKILGVPAWFYNGNITYGTQNYKQLKILYNYND